MDVVLVGATGKPASVLRREGWSDDEIARCLAASMYRQMAELEAVEEASRRAH